MPPIMIKLIDGAIKKIINELGLSKDLIVQAADGINEKTYYKILNGKDVTVSPKVFNILRKKLSVVDPSLLTDDVSAYQLKFEGTKLHSHFPKVAFDLIKMRPQDIKPLDNLHWFFITRDLSENALNNLIEIEKLLNPPKAKEDSLDHSFLDHKQKSDDDSQESPFQNKIKEMRNMNQVSDLYTRLNEEYGVYLYHGWYAGVTKKVYCGYRDGGREKIETNIDEFTLRETKPLRLCQIFYNSHPRNVICVTKFPNQRSITLRVPSGDMQGSLLHNGKFLKYESNKIDLPDGVKAHFEELLNKELSKISDMENVDSKNLNESNLIWSIAFDNYYSLVSDGWDNLSANDEIPFHFWEPQSHSGLDFDHMYKMHKNTEEGDILFSGLKKINIHLEADLNLPSDPKKTRLYSFDDCIYGDEEFIEIKNP